MLAAIALPAAGFALRPGGRAVLAAVVLLAAGCAPGPRDGTPGTDSAVLEAGSAAATASATAAGGSMPDAAAAAGADLLGRPPVEHRQWTKRFDPHFRKYAKRFFGVGLDWRWFKAQGIAESGLRENAESWVGAKGIMQIMPATLQEIAAKSSLQVLDGSDPGQNIAAGVFYDRHLYDLWDDVPDAGERLAFTFASYNGGRSRMLRAQERCTADCATWGRVAPYAPAETSGYVARILTLMGLAPADG